MLQALARRQGLRGSAHFSGQIGAGDGHGRARVRDVVLQLFGAVHGVDRHHHGIGSQNTKVSGYPLRAVLHVQQHTVALFDAVGSQPGGYALGLLQEFAVAEGAAQKHQRVFVGKAFGADGQVVPQGGLRRGKSMRHAQRPMGVMRFHGGEA